jgi:hypothetical protein
MPMEKPMKAFPDPLVFSHAGTANGSAIFRLTLPFRYLSTEHGEIEVPAGFHTDGASVPRVFWNILSPFGDYFPAALIHDYLYSPNNRWFTRWQADKIFLAAMVDAGVPFIRRRVIYRAVRVGGWASFRGNPPD